MKVNADKIQRISVDAEYAARRQEKRRTENSGADHPEGKDRVEISQESRQKNQDEQQEK